MQQKAIDFGVELVREGGPERGDADPVAQGQAGHLHAQTGQAGRA